MCSVEDIGFHGRFSFVFLGKGLELAAKFGGDVGKVDAEFDEFGVLVEDFAEHGDAGDFDAGFGMVPCAVLKLAGELADGALNVEEEVFLEVGFVFEEFAFEEPKGVGAAVIFNGKLSVGVAVFGRDADFGIGDYATKADGFVDEGGEVGKFSALCVGEMSYFEFEVVERVAAEVEPDDGKFFAAALHDGPFFALGDVWMGVFFYLVAHVED